MRETITTVIVTCDICGNEMEDYRVGETLPSRAKKIIFERWYASDMTFDDICKDCSSKIVSFIDGLSKTK